MGHYFPHLFLIGGFHKCLFPFRKWFENANEAGFEI